MRKLLLLALCQLFLLGFVLAQERTISGKVTDDKGSPIASASVVVKGSRLGTVTKPDGTYSITVPASARTLIFSAVGSATQEANIEGQTVINLSLKMDLREGQEVVVVAYGQQKRSDMTGSVASLKGSEIENQPFTSLDKALQGQIPGLQSVAASGAPGSNQQIRIRGISSITAGNQPLWVIDGVIINPNDLSRLTTTANILSTLNPNDIESISVLKDAASASIYGSRAATGVILVTTKKGRPGKTKIRVDMELGQSDVAVENDRYQSLNSSEYIALTTEGLVNFGATPAQITSTMAARGANSGIDFNWRDAVTQKGTQQQYNVSASGGNERTTFYLSGGYFQQEGTAIASWLKRYTGNIRLSNKINDKITVSANLNTGFVRQFTPLNGGAFGNPLLSSFFILPTRSAYKADGSPNILTPEFPTNNLFNTVALATMDKRYLKELSMRGSVSIEYNIINDLKFKSVFGGDFNSLEEDQYNNPLYGDGAVLDPGPPASPTFNPGIRYLATTTGRAFSAYTRYFNWTWTNTLDYRRNITHSGDLYFTALVGYESQLSKNYFTTLQGRGFSTSPLLYLQYPSSASTPSTATGAISDYSFASAFTVADIHFKEKFILSGSFRNDGSSRFGVNNRYGNFWSIGASWNVEKEAFMQNVSFIDQLKLRASYGLNGNGNIGNYDQFPLYGFTGTYNSAPGSVPSNVGNLDLTWELNRPLNIGIDVGLLKGRASVTFDWYKRKSEELLLNVPLSPTSGFATQTRNVGVMENRGFELTLAGTPIKTRDLAWTINFNISKNKNKVISLPDHNPIIGTFIIKEGLDVQTFYARIYAGVDAANGDPLWYMDSSRKLTTNNYNLALRVPYASASPDYFGALNNTITFKGFTLDAQLNFNAGNFVQDTWASYYLGAGFNAGFNKVKRVMERWQKPGDVTDIPKYIEGGNKLFHNFSTIYLAKGNFIRLRNVQLGYSLPTSVLSRLKLSSAFFYVRGTNLWTKVKDKNLGFDPEQGVSSQTNLDVFIPKTMTVGVNFGF